MRKEYDFSKGIRGKFYFPNAKYNEPIYLETEVYKYLNNLALEKELELNAVVNELLKKDISILELKSRSKM